VLFLLLARPHGSNCADVLHDSDRHFREAASAICQRILVYDGKSGSLPEALTSAMRMARMTA
jgi:hypothetical protein